MGIPAFITEIVVICSFKRLALVEILFPIMYIVAALLKLFVSQSKIFGELDDLTRL